MRALFWAGFGVFMACIGIWACIDAPKTSLLRFKKMDEKIEIGQQITNKRIKNVCIKTTLLAEKIDKLEYPNGHPTNENNFDAVRYMGSCVDYLY